MVLGFLYGLLQCTHDGALRQALHGSSNGYTVKSPTDLINLLAFRPADGVKHHVIYWMATPSHSEAAVWRKVWPEASAARVTILKDVQPVNDGWMEDVLEVSMAADERASEIEIANGEDNKDQ